MAAPVVGSTMLRGDGVAAGQAPDEENTQGLDVSGGRWQVGEGEGGASG